MEITAPTSEEREVGVYAWFTIKKGAYGTVLGLALPGTMESRIGSFVRDAQKHGREFVSVALESKGEVAILRYAGAVVRAN